MLIETQITPDVNVINFFPAEKVLRSGTAEFVRQISAQIAVGRSHLRPRRRQVGLSHFRHDFGNKGKQRVLGRP